MLADAALQMAPVATQGTAPVIVCGSSATGSLSARILMVDDSCLVQQLLPWPSECFDSLVSGDALHRTLEACATTARGLVFCFGRTTRTVP